MATGLPGGIYGTPKGNVFILLGNGDGTFQVAAHFEAGYGPVWLAVADLNGDGRQDLVSANFASHANRPNYVTVIDESDLRVFLGNGDGTFQAAQLYKAGNGPTSVIVTDINADGIPDLVVGNGGDNKVSVLLGIGDGTFQRTQNYGVGAYPRSLAVADFNGDGYPDVAAAAGTVTILINAANW